MENNIQDIRVENQETFQQRPSDEFIHHDYQNSMPSETEKELQRYIQKYSDMSEENAKKSGVLGAKNWVTDYVSGDLLQQDPSLTQDQILQHIKNQENLVNDKEVLSDSYFDLLTDVPKQLVGSIRDMAQSFNEVLQDVGVPVGNLPEVSDPKTLAGRLTRVMGSYLTTYLGQSAVLAKTGLQATSIAGKAVESLGKGAVSDLLSTTGNEENLSAVIEDTPLKNPVTNYLKSDPDDSVAEAKLKAAVEGAALGAITESAFKFIKLLKKESIVREADKIFKKDSLDRVTDTQSATEDIKRAIDSLPKRNKTPKTLQEIGSLADGAEATKETLLSGEIQKKVEKSIVKSEAVKATKIQQKYTDRLRDAVPDYRGRVISGDKEAINQYWDEVIELTKLDYAAKNLAAIEGGAESLVYRSHSDAVNTANALRTLMENQPTITKQKAVEAHMDLLTMGGTKQQIDRFIQNISDTPQDKISNFIQGLYYGHILSSDITIAKNVVDGVFNGVILNPIESTAAAAIGSARRVAGSALGSLVDRKIESGFFSGLEDTHRYKEAVIAFKSLGESTYSGLKYMVDAITANTEYAKKLADTNSKWYKKYNPASDIAERAEQFRFDKGARFEGTKFTVSSSLSNDMKQQWSLKSPFYALADAMSSVASVSGSIIRTGDNILQGAFFDLDVKRKVYRDMVNNRLDSSLAGKTYDNIVSEAITRTNEEGLPKWANVKTQYSKNDYVAGLQSDSVNFARTQTYQNKTGAIGASLRTFRDGLDDIIPTIPAGSLIMPFVNTATNILQYTLAERSPFALLTKKFWGDLSAGGVTSEQTLSKFLVGSSAMYYAYDLALQNRVTGNSIKDPAEREYRNQLGVLPNSVRIGKNYVDIGWMGYLGTMLQVPANAVEIMRYMDDDVDSEDYQNLLGYLAISAMSFGEAFSSKSAAKNTMEVMKALTETDSKALKKIANRSIAGLLIPNIITSTGRKLDDIRYEADGLLETLQVKLGMGTRPYRDIFGRELRRNPYVNSMFMPSEYAEYRDDPVYANLMAAGAYIKKPLRNIEGVRLSPKQYDELMSYMQEFDVYGTFEKMVNSGVMKSLSNTASSNDILNRKRMRTRREEFLKQYSKFLDVARQLVKANPDNRDLLEKIVDKKVKAMTEDNMSSHSKSLLGNFPLDSIIK